MPIALKLATPDTPEPWQAAEIAELEYAREGIVTAPPRTWLRIIGWAVWAVVRRGVLLACWCVGAGLTLVAFLLLLAGTVIRLGVVGVAWLLLGLRRLSPVRGLRRLAEARRVPFAQVA